MAVSVFPSLALALLAGFVIEDVGIGRTELGIAIALISGVAAATSLRSGQVADQRGGRTALLIVFALGAAAIGGMAVAPTLPILLGTTLVAGLCSGASNPATNKVLVETLEPGRRGVVTGLKQAGEMVAVVASGLLLPAAAVALGWRLALALALVVPVAAFVAVLRVIPVRSVVEMRRAEGAEPALAPGIVWLAVYAGFMGLAGNSVISYLSLYAQESIGLPVTLAGAVVALTGTVAIAGRIAWAEVAERTGDYNRVLAIASLVAMASATSLWLAGLLGNPTLLWLGAAGWGASLLSFASVAMLAVMAMSTPDAAGRASGVVLTGFSLGLMVGPPLFGFLTDLTGAYDAGLALVILVLVVALATTSRLPSRERRRAAEPRQI
jgi:predicted MFS family arabinose efflux permease